MNDYVVYKHTAPNGKVYIGITHQDLSKRWKKGLGYKGNPYFFRAIKKYGWDNIKHEVLFDSLPKEQAEKIEISLIKEYDSANRDNGYNIALGGNSNAPTKETKEKTSASVKKFWADDDNKKKMSNAMCGAVRTDEAKKNISEAQKKRFSNQTERIAISERQKGKKRSETAKRKTSESLKQYYANAENKAQFFKAHEGVNRATHARAVTCIETGEIFEAVIDAEKKFGIDHRNITAVCKGKRKKAGGFSWAYYGEQLKNEVV